MAERKRSEETKDFSLDSTQREALLRTLKNKVSVITGGPGVGKTTIVKAYLLICEKLKQDAVLMAPTGRAAKRLKEATEAEATTIHRALKAKKADNGAWRGQFEHDRSSPMQGDVFVIDESSMLDVRLASALLDAIPDNASVVFIGDADQLPSVGAGQVLSDIIDSGVVPVSHLTQIHRQGKASLITKNAHRVNMGLMPDMHNSIDEDFFFVPSEDPEDCVAKISKIITERIPDRFGFDSSKDIQVLCPMKSSLVGTENLNRHLQFVMNPLAKRHLSGEKIDTDLFYQDHFRSLFVGDKVMQIKNDYEKKVYNGDIGYIKEVDRIDRAVYVEFEENIAPEVGAPGEVVKVSDKQFFRTVRYGFEELGSLILAYACTVHKSQGSEYPVVVIPVMKQHYIMLRRKILYTGITRGRKLVILVGQKDAIKIAACFKDKEPKRYTKLCDFLKEI